MDILLQFAPSGYFLKSYLRIGSSHCQNENTMSMQITILPSPVGPLAVIYSGNMQIKELQDALDLIAECNFLDAVGMILYQHQLAPELFDLKTGLAGEVLQKFSTYRMKLAVVGDFSGFSSRSLQDFIRESNRQGQVCFVSSEEEGVEMLGKKR